MIPGSLVFWQFFFVLVQHTIQRWTKPATALIVVGALSDLNRNQAELIVENALLRQQLIVLNRQVKRPKLNNGDRLRMVLLARCTRFWEQAIHIVQPDTLLRWQREKSKPKKKKPRISLDLGL